MSNAKHEKREALTEEMKKERLASAIANLYDSLVAASTYDFYGATRVGRAPGDILKEIYDLEKKLGHMK